ncbi:hypothetical protein NEILACOT_05549 [Neisseria lactamica ATCC 23970]|uniref:Uncharacterized protein n=1 Tax=Neisseria lactamica ATCC 23970 TaxID=546265 RepID=D0WDB3_NEILA|nr:hypothetical protein NEILACOT_05549 [Neisseria lactamica ATCC 23970]
MGIKIEIQTGCPAARPCRRCGFRRHTRDAPVPSEAFSSQTK